MSTINQSKLGPLKYPVILFLSGIFLTTIFRLVHFSLYYERLFETPQFWRIFPIGLRMDVILMSYLTILPTLLLLLLPKDLILKFKWFFCFWATLVLGSILYMEIATFPFMEEYDVRPDRKFLEYLKHTREVMGLLWGAYKMELFFGTGIVFIACLILWKKSRKVVLSYSPWNYKIRLIVLPVVLALLVLGARSSLGHRPANLSTAAFSNNHLANELALNSTYSVLYAGYRYFSHEKDPSGMYGKMPIEEAITRVKAISTIPEENYIQSEIPLLHKQDSPFNLERPMNVVIFLQESVGAVDVGCLKGPPITPNLCALKDEGLWFDNLYATGTRTVRGIEAVFSGFLPTANQGMVKLELAKTGFFSAASLFKKHGYQTNFIYGGMSNFDEMKSFVLGNGVDQIYDEPTFENPVFHGTWGVSDEDLVRKANEIFKGYGDKPFFSLMLSTTNHTPYEFPDGRIELYEEPKQTHFNAVKYADYAIGLLIELAKKEEYFKNTLFLIVADHNSHVRGNDLVPLEKYQIPGLILGANVPKQSFSLLSSQIDLLPTLLHFTGLDTIHPMIGRNLMDLPKNSVGRAFMQYEHNNAYLVGNKVIMNQPFLQPLQFDIVDGKLIQTELDAEMAKDALAHIYLPWHLYSKKLYRIPE